MIDKDQPSIFGKEVVAGISSTSDGNIKYLDKGLAQVEVDENRIRFLARLGLHPEQTVLVKVTYDGTDYTRYHVVDENNKGQGFVKPIQLTSDSLATETKNIALFLPIADCVGAILYDPPHNALMVAHLGRQATEQHGATKNVAFMEKVFGTRPADLKVWLSPAPGREAYPLFSFDNRGLHDVTVQHLKDAGVDPAAVAVCSVDTTKGQDYFSHSEFLKGNREVDGRYGIVAMLK